MTVLTGSCTADIQRCWAVVEDVARAPEWQRTLERLEVVERDDQGRPSICDTVSNAHLTKVECLVRMHYEPPQRLSWSRVESEDLDAIDGSWELEDLGEGRTRATYSLAVDPGPIGFLARPIERLLRPLVIGHQAEELAEELARAG